MADILIRDMEMPENCMDCFFCLFCLNTKDDCPLVPLPEGHGRCIDADALKENLREVDYWNGSEYIISEQDINDAPTIIPAEGDGQR